MCLEQVLTGRLGTTESNCTGVDFTMNTHDGSKGSKEQEYLSKKVLVNGQFVTLYSINGQTWLSSPEEIPELMARLENARIMLANPEKAEGEAPPAKAPTTDAQAPKVAQNKYRMKGPKPRPILKQGGVVIKGTPIEPISASGTVMSFSHDQEMAGDSKSESKRGRAEPQKGKAAVKAKSVAPKHIAPVLAAVGKSKKQPVPEKPVTKAAASKAPVAGKTKLAAVSVKQAVSKRAPVVKAASAKKASASERKVAPVNKVAKAKVVKTATKSKASKTKPANAKKKTSR